MSDKSLTAPPFNQFTFHQEGEYEDYREALRRWKEDDDPAGKLFVWTIARYVSWVEVYSDSALEDVRYAQHRPDIVEELILSVMGGMPDKCQLGKGSTFGWLKNRAHLRLYSVKRKFFGADNRGWKTWNHHMGKQATAVAAGEWYKDVDDERRAEAAVEERTIQEREARCKIIR